MDFYDINCLGKIKIERVTSLPTWTSDDEGRVLLLTSTKELYIGTDTSWDAVATSATFYSKAEVDASFMHTCSCDETAYGSKTFCCGLYLFRTVCSSTSSNPLVCMRNTAVDAYGSVLKVTSPSCWSYSQQVENVNTSGINGALFTCSYVAVPYQGTIKSCNMCAGNAGYFEALGGGFGIYSYSSNTAITACTASTGPAIYARTDAINSSGVYAASTANGTIAVRGYGCGTNGGIGIYGYSIYSQGVRAHNLCCCTASAVPNSSVPAGVYGTSVSGIGVCGCTAASYGVIGYATNWVGVMGCAALFPVVGNGGYWDLCSSRNVKYTCNICISKCLKDKPLPIYRYTYIDTAQKSYDEFIGPLSEDFTSTFDTHNEVGEGDELYGGLYTVDGVALGLGIENMNKIDTLISIIKILTKELKALKEKSNGS